MSPKGPLSRRALFATIGALGAGAVLAACDTGTQTPQASVASLKVPSALPATFTGSARWQLPTVETIPPVQLPEGIAVLAHGARDHAKYRVTLVDPATGAARWSSLEFSPAADGAPTPKMAGLTTQGESWVAVTTVSGPNTITLDLYQAEGAGDRREPERSFALEGPDMGTLPTLHIGERGAFVSGLAGGPADAVYTLSLSDGSGTPWGGPGQLAGVWDEGQVITDDGGFAFIVGGAPAWSSADFAPTSGGESGTSGSLRAVGAGVLVAQWTVGGSVVLAVHAVRTGEVLAQVALRGSLDDSGTTVLASPDGEWVSWGPYVFGLRGGKSSLLSLRGTSPVTLYRDVLYVDGSSVPLTADSASGASDDGGASDGGGASGSARYGGLLDVQSHEWLTNSPVEAVPVFVSSASQGVFVVEDRKAWRVFSVPVA